MLEIARGRTWSQSHTVLDTEIGPPSNLAAFVSVRSQIREKTAVRNARGIFEHKLVANVTVTVYDNVITQSLSRAATNVLQPGDFLIDIVGTYTNGDDESLLDPEPIKVTNRPTSAIPGDAIPADTPTNVPNFAGEFTDALT